MTTIDCQALLKLSPFESKQCVFSYSELALKFTEYLVTSVSQSVLDLSHKHVHQNNDYSEKYERDTFKYRGRNNYDDNR